MKYKDTIFFCLNRDFTARTMIFCSRHCGLDP